NRCSCQDWRLWSTAISDTSFRLTDLRYSALGGVHGGSRNSYRHIDFTKADLRRTAYTSAEFVACMFRDTRLEKVNFAGSTFVDCTFEGQLNEVCFNQYAFGEEGLPPNEMQRVDFSQAELRAVEFRGLDLRDVHFPKDEDHIVLNNYGQTLDRLVEAF